MREVVDELRPDALEPAQLGYVLEHEPGATTCGGLGADGQDRSVRSGGADLRARRARARLGGSSGQALDRRVHERFHQRAPRQTVGAMTEQLVGACVGLDDAQRRVDAHDPDVQGLPKGLVIGCAIGQLADPGIVLGTRPLKGCGHAVDLVSAPDEGDGGTERGQRQQDSHEDARFHAASIAYPSVPGPAVIDRVCGRRMARSARPDRRATGPHDDRTPATGTRVAARADARSVPPRGEPRSRSGYRVCRCG